MTNAELLELAKLNLQAFENRRGMEWQLLLGYWTGLGLTTYMFVSGTVAVTGVTLWVVIAFLIGMLVVLVRSSLPRERETRVAELVDAGHGVSTPPSAPPAS